MARAFTWQPTPERFGQIPRDRGIVFICMHCARPAALPRDLALKEWGARGVIREVAQRLRCRNCKRRGMHTSLAPHYAQLGTPTPLDQLVMDIRSLRVRHTIR